MTRKSFRTSSGTNIIDFDIDGEVFRCHATMGAGIMMNFADLTSGDVDNPVSGQKMITAVRDFFRSALIDEDRDRFFELLNAPDRYVDLGTLIEIATWLGQEYTARPTGSPSASTSRETESGGSSTAGVQSGVTTYTRKDPQPAL